jgi:hypothetical protein
MQSSLVNSFSKPAPLAGLKVVSSMAINPSSQSDTSLGSLISSSAPKPDPQTLLNFRNSQGTLSVDNIKIEHVEEFKSLILDHSINLANKLGLSINDLDVDLSSDGKSLSIKLKASTLNFFGLDQYGVAYLSHCDSLGFKASWLGLKFKPNDTEMVITGYDNEKDRIRVFTGVSSIWVRNISFNKVKSHLEGLTSL